MKSYIAFVKKEFLESIRTYKLMIILAVSLLFGMSNPVIAKLTPELMKVLETQGIQITLPDPTAADSWIQFYKNMTGMQIIIFAILFSGVIATELSKGTLINMLTKGLSRKTVILSKLTSTSIIWTVSYVFCFGVTYAYTLFLLPNNDLPNIFFSAFCLWLFGIMLITIMILGGVLFANIFGSLLFTGGFTLLLTLINFIPKVSDYNPNKLGTDNMQLLTGGIAKTDFVLPIIMACIVSIAATISSLMLFNKKQL